MSIAKIKLDEDVSLEFGVAITGASGSPQSRLVIEGKDFAVSFPCKEVTGGVAAHVTNLKHVLPAGEYPVRLEIVVENKIYTPFQDTIILEPTVEVTTKPAARASVKESIVVDKAVLVNTVTTTEDQKRVASALAALVKYIPEHTQTPQQIIAGVMHRIDDGVAHDPVALRQLLRLAEQVGISFGDHKHV